MTDNIILKTDSYKVSHWRQYPHGTRYVHSFFESRGGRYPETTFFGLQYIVAKHLVGEVVTAAGIDEAEEFYAAHFGSRDVFFRGGWEYILKTHGGRLPVEIRAVAEGTSVPVHNVLMTVHNTDPAVPWLTSYLETLLVQAWYPTTVCTQSRAMRAVIMRFLEETGDPAGVDFKLHDFGYRGSTSDESAGIGGAAHLVNFKGSDTVAALQVARDYYDEPMAGFSIPAAEHSTITSWGRDHEVDAFKNMLDQFPKGLVAVVSDSYDIYAACRDLWGTKLWQQVSERDGTLVVRPDSGELPRTLLNVLQLLGEKFGTTENAKGFKVLNPKVRVIQGDGIDYITMESILAAMKDTRWSADNIAFGSGGGLLQKVDRDTQKFAFKCSAVWLDGYWRDVYKAPVTDVGKRSRAGVTKLVMGTDGVPTTVGATEAGRSLLEPVFVNGKMTKRQTLAEIRGRAALTPLAAQLAGRL